MLVPSMQAVSNECRLELHKANVDYTRTFKRSKLLQPVFLFSLPEVLNRQPPLGQ